MKKKFLLAITFVSMLMACDSLKNNTASSFTINAEFIGVEDTTPIYLQLVEEGKLKAIDSANLMSSKVTFTGTMEAPEMLEIS